MKALRAARRFLGLGRADQLLLTRAFLALALVDLRCRLLGFQGVIDSLPPPGVDGSPMPSEELRKAQHYARSLEIAGRHHFVRARCLHQSLALRGWLRAEGLPAHLRIGVRTVDGSLLAHAWVELGGEVVNDRADAVSGFTPLTSPGAAASVKHPLAGEGQARYEASAAAGLGGAQWS